MYHELDTARREIAGADVRFARNTLPISPISASSTRQVHRSSLTGNPEIHSEAESRWLCGRRPRRQPAIFPTRDEESRIRSPKANKVQHGGKVIADRPFSCLAMSLISSADGIETGHKLPMNARRSAGWILGRHTKDQSPDLRIHTFSAAQVPGARYPGAFAGLMALVTPALSSFRFSGLPVGAPSIPG